MQSGWCECVWLALCLVLCASSVGAGQPPAIPYYPGGQVEMEARLTSDDLLPFALQSVSGEDLASSLDRVFAGVTGMQVLEMTISSPVDQLQVIGFYSRIPQSARMTRIFKQYDPAGGVVLVWSGPRGNGLFGLQLARADDEPGRGAQWRLQVARLQGVLDVQALLKELKSDKLLPVYPDSAANQPPGP